MYQWAVDLFPIARSITGPGVRETLTYLKKIVNEISVISVPSGTEAFDWIVPEEWSIREAFIESEDGERVIDFKKHNLHVVGYSTAVDEWIPLEALQEHLHSLPDQPQAIPYVTSYYKRQWGFCLSHDQRTSLRSGNYRVVIDAEHKPGVLNYGELRIAGESQQEVFLSTYICHPSLANNELSGPVVTTALGRWLRSLPYRRYSYRIVFLPETIGSIVYLSRHLDELKSKVIAGFNVNCVGDDRCYSYLPSRAGNTLADQAALHVLHHIDANFKRYTWLDRGSDERQYCAPGIDLPVASIMRSRFRSYPEYHTSLDDLSVISPAGLFGGFSALQRAIEIIERNCKPEMTVFGEPQLGKRNLYPSTSSKTASRQHRSMMDLISYCDGKHSLLEIAELLDQPFMQLHEHVQVLERHNLLRFHPSV